MTEPYQSRLAAWENACLAPRPSPSCEVFEPTSIEKVAMRDGVHLYTEVFLPERQVSQALPIILWRSPYVYSRFSRGVGRAALNQFLTAGYGLVFQLTRGQGQSEGCFRRYLDDSEDGYDTVQWIAEQPWSNGRIGMAGGSYAGSTQLLAAKTKPAALKCIMPTAFVGNNVTCYPFSYGVPKKSEFMLWHQLLDVDSGEEMDVDSGDLNKVLKHPRWGAALHQRPLIDAANDVLCGDKLDNWRTTVSTPLDNDFWRPVHFTNSDLAELDLPIFFTDGWYDQTIGPIDFFTRLEQLQPKRPDRYLLIGPWDHVQTQQNSAPGEESGGRILPDNAAPDLLAQRLAFFDRYLKGDTTVDVQLDRVSVYITGAPDSKANVWLNLPTFPALGTEYRSLYLHSQGDAHAFPGNGVLSWETPDDAEPTDHYTYDPALPTNFQLETARDRREVEIRSDVLTYTSEPLDKPMTILGDIKLTLYAASDAPDTDWFAVLTEVLPDGQSKSFHYAPPAFRARYRQGFNKEVLLTPNQPEEFQIPMGPAGHQIAPGHRLRLSIFSAAFPEYEPNTNTGNEAATDTEWRIARQTIFHNRPKPSHLVLPVIPLESIQGKKSQ